MGWDNARDFLTRELSEGNGEAAEYDFTVGGTRQYKVIVLPNNETVTLTRIRKRTLNDGYNSVNFAPTNGCPVCGR